MLSLMLVLIASVSQVSAQQEASTDANQSNSFTAGQPLRMGQMPEKKGPEVSAELVTKVANHSTNSVPVSKLEDSPAMRTESAAPAVANPSASAGTVPGDATTPKDADAVKKVPSSGKD
jgi:hypothetical protein